MRTMPMKKIYLSLAGMLLVVLLASCASSPKAQTEQTTQQGTGAPPGKEEPSYAVDMSAPKASAPEVTYFVHTVKWRGESVSIIAGWYTGDIQNWKTLKECNPDINPSRIFEGMKIRIPENMMKTKAPMPKEYVDGYYPKQQKKDAGRSSPQSSSEAKEPTLFGPK